MGFDSILSAVLWSRGQENFTFTWLTADFTIPKSECYDLPPDVNIAHTDKNELATFSENSISEKILKCLQIYIVA